MTPASLGGEQWKKNKCVTNLLSLGKCFVYSIEGNAFFREVHTWSDSAKRDKNNRKECILLVYKTQLKAAAL